METQNLIQKIEKLRGSRVITYFTNDRQGPVNARVAMDIIPIISSQLRKIGKQEKIDLVLYSAGGDTLVPWRLVSLIREYCDHFSVIVPYKAHSAATMISLGADEIVMSDMSELSPIDPSTANIFNPIDPQNPQSRIPISVEEVMNYFDLAKNKFGIKSDEELTKIFNKFVESNPSIHPLALGNVNRTYNLIKILAKRLLKSHKAQMKDGEIEKLIEFLTEKLYSHQYYFGRREAKEELGIKTVIFADENLSNLMTKIYDEYEREMQMTKLWNPEIEIDGKPENKKEYKIAFVESAETSHHYGIIMEFKKVQQSIAQQTPMGPINIPQEQIVWRIVGQGWG
jgi:hypothetical protein